MGVDVAGTCKGFPRESEVLKHAIDPGIDWDIGRTEGIEVVSSRGRAMIRAGCWSFGPNDIKLCLVRALVGRLLSFLAQLCMIQPSLIRIRRHQAGRTCECVGMLLSEDLIPRLRY